MTTLDQQLKSIDIRLTELEREKKTLLDRQQELLALRGTGELSTRTPGQALSTKRKIELFRDLFRGRDDTYALRWENSKGRSGYAVSCANEWRQGLCDKPRVKCGECPNRAFNSIDDTAIHGHLTGKHTVGLYPLLDDDQCWLLAVDFDKADWQLAVKSFRSVCIDWKLPCAVERSRSGNGAHIWIFFDSPIPARDARKLGFALLDRAMDSHAGLSFSSYDRFFPNQDTMPSGGFGNLIALPLQKNCRESGHSEFIDERFDPYPDQWSFLASIDRVTPTTVYDCLHHMEQSIGPGVSELKPWEAGLPVARSQIENCPRSVDAVVANKIYLPTANLPQALVARLKRIASFSNPVFFKTQAMRFSTNGIPRFICLAQIDQGYLSLPRGCIDEVVSLFSQQSIILEIEDKRRIGERLDGLRFIGELRKDQAKAVRVLSRHETGVLHAPTAFGKTVTAIGLIQKRKVSTLILVHNRQLLDQWKERLSSFLAGVEIGSIGGGKRKPTGKIDVATYQSLIKRADNSVDGQIHDYGQIIIDECHHISAPQYEMLLSEVHARYVLGITATPNRQDGHDPIIFMQSGPIRYFVKEDHAHQFEQRVIIRNLSGEAPQESGAAETLPQISSIYQWLMEDSARNSLIVSDVVSAVSNQRNPIVLTERREHARIMAELLTAQGISCQVLRGAMKVRERKAAMDALGESQVIIATGKYIGEGFDLPKLDTLFLAMPISWKGTLAQYVGRIHRQAPEKDCVIVYDYVDGALQTLQRMYKRRERGYTAMGYTIGTEEFGW